ncbi:MAG: hydroxymethylglutaryl-CoA lyase [Ferruginibacter sp.]
MEGTPLKIVECPRDAMQGWPHIISTAKKLEYLHALLKVGFHTLDFGSFVSPKAIPQMADTKDIVKQLDMAGSKTKLLAIVANERGAQDAVVFDEISFLGFPFSVSETFQQRNTGSSIAGSLERVEEIQNLCIKNRKELVVYISMGFGNPYGDDYNEQIVFDWVNKLVNMDIKIISLADTVGIATAAQVERMTKYLLGLLPQTEIGVHLHSTSENWEAKLDAAFNAGCRRFDGALKGIGGCPMAGNDLVGNMDTERMLSYFKNKEIAPILNEEALQECVLLAGEIFRS